MDHLMTSLAAVILACMCMCVTSLPLHEDGDISKLSDLLGKLRTLQRKRQDSQNWKHFKSAVANDGKAELSDLGNPNGAIGDGDMFHSVNGDTAGVMKRQGAWSYDYGLGGGRFGKRNYGDYGIGGGRFGRDVDHVDLAD